MHTDHDSCYLCTRLNPNVTVLDQRPIATADENDPFVFVAVCDDCFCPICGTVIIWSGANGFCGCLNVKEVTCEAR